MSLPYEELARDYAAHRRVHPEVLLKLVAGARLDASSRVLELGCGIGHYLRRLRRTAGCRGLGIDPSPAMLEHARAEDPDLEWREAAAEALDPAWGPFDLAFSVDVVHHLEDRTEVWRRTRDALAPGGSICTVTDSEDIIRHREPLAVFFPETIELDLARYPRVDELHDEMRRAGFVDLRDEEAEFSYITTDVAPWRARAYSCLRLIPREAFQRGMMQLEEAARGGVGCCHRYVLLWARRPA